MDISENNLSTEFNLLGVLTMAVNFNFFVFSMFLVFPVFLQVSQRTTPYHYYFFSTVKFSYSFFLIFIGLAFLIFLGFVDFTAPYFVVLYFLIGFVAKSVNECHYLLTSYLSLQIFSMEHFPNFAKSFDSKFSFRKIMSIIYLILLLFDMIWAASLFRNAPESVNFSLLLKEFQVLNCILWISTVFSLAVRINRDAVKILFSDKVRKYFYHQAVLTAVIRLITSPVPMGWYSTTIDMNHRYFLAVVSDTLSNASIIQFAYLNTHKDEIIKKSYLKYICPKKASSQTVPIDN